MIHTLFKRFADALNHLIISLFEYEYQDVLEYENSKKKT